VLAPPSRHVSGGRYRWLRTLDQASLPEVPAALRALLEPHQPPARPSPLGGFRPAELGHPYVAGGLLDEEETTVALTTVARSLGLGAAEVRRTLASARTAARAFPRGLPARPEHGQGGA
jgi:hypothetical protein